MPKDHNPFGVFIRTARGDDLIIRPGGVLRHGDWGHHGAIMKSGSAARTAC